jgi:HEAT repeat protein
MKKKQRIQIKPALSGFTLIITLLLAILYCTTQSSLENLLESIATYEQGQSRQQLSEIEILVQQAANLPQKALPMEQQLNRFLQSDATLDSKQFICRQLGLIGTEYSAPVLSQMILDSATSEMARYALELIPGQKINDALREALKKADDKLKPGIITTLGLREDTASVNLLGQILQNADPQLAPFAAAAIGEIANDQAVQILQLECGKQSGNLKDDILHACLSCANKQAAMNHTQEAAALFQEIYSKAETYTIRAGALRGLLISNPSGAGLKILNILNSNDIPMQTVAIQSLEELPVVEDIQEIAKRLPQLTPLIQLQLISALAAREDQSIREDIINALKLENGEVRLAAIKALGQLGDDTTIPILVKIAASGTADEAEFARESLARLRTGPVDKTLISLLPQADQASKIELINAINERRIFTADRTVLSFITNPESPVRLAAIKCLGTIAPADMLPQLLSLVLETKSSGESAVLEQSIVEIVRRNYQSVQAAKPIMDRYAETESTNQKAILLRLLGKLRAPASLVLIRSELNNENTELQYAAIQALNNWQSEAFSDDLILDDLLTITQTSGNEKNRILALRGFLHLTAIIGRNNPDKALQKYRDAVKYATQIDEKRIILSGLQAIRTIDALQMAYTFLKDPELVPEAETTILILAPDLLTEHPDAVKEQLELIIQTSKNNQHIEEAKKILNQ